MNNERICRVCGTHYSYCTRCRQYEDLPTWMMSFDSDACHNIYLTINKYAFGHIGADEAKEALEKYKDVKIVNDEINDLIKSMESETSSVGAQKKTTRKKKVETAESESVSE